MRILFFDIESAPLLGYFWRPDQDYIAHDFMVADSYMLGYSARFRGERTIHSDILTSSEAKRQHDDRIVVGLGRLIRKADLIVAHNIRRFDLPVFNGRLLMRGLEPLGPVQTIDTFVLAKQNFGLPYYKLDYLAERLGLGKKIKTDFELWRRCYLGDEAALAKMHRYNRRDVVLLEQVFEKMLPYVKSLPRLVVAGGPDDSSCPLCAYPGPLAKRGFHENRATRFQTYQCPRCTRYSRVRVADKTHRLTLVPL